MTELEYRSSYNKMTSNDPLIHCNRFPSWEELTENQRETWRLQHGKLQEIVDPS